MDLNNIDESLEYIRNENKRLREHYGYKEKKDAVYPGMLKLMEEVGELSEAILQKQNIQRKDKLDSKKTDIGSELADILFVTFLLAENLDIDLVEEVKKKGKKISERKY